MFMPDGGHRLSCSFDALTEIWWSKKRQQKTSSSVIISLLEKLVPLPFVIECRFLLELVRPAHMSSFWVVLKCDATVRCSVNFFCIICCGKLWCLVVSKNNCHKRIQMSLRGQVLKNCCIKNCITTTGTSSIWFPTNWPQTGHKLEKENMQNWLHLLCWIRQILKSYRFSRKIIINVLTKTWQTYQDRLV